MDLEPVKVLVRREQGTEDIPLPEYHTEGSSGLDLRAAVEESVVIKPGEFKLIPTGLRLSIPRGYEGQVRPRSGLASKYGITVLNSPGTIDSDYRGPLIVLLVNAGREDFVVNRGDRIAQLVIVPIVKAVMCEVRGLDETQRGEGGFGHTGVSN